MELANTQVLHFCVGAFLHSLSSRNRAAMPFALNHKRYMMRLAPEGGAGATVSFMWGCYDRDFDYETDQMRPPEEAVGRDYNVLFKFAVGPVTKDRQGERRNARISAYMAPTPEDDDDAKYVGMCIDEGNEAILVKGTPTTFHIKSIKAPRDDHTRAHVFPGMTFFVEWSNLDDREVAFLPVVPAPLAYMQVLERTAEVLCPHRLAAIMNQCKETEVAPIPLPPKARTKPLPAKRARAEDNRAAEGTGAASANVEDSAIGRASLRRPAA